MPDKLPKCPHCGQTIRRSRKRPPTLVIKNVQVVAVNYVCPRGDPRLTHRFDEKFGVDWTHGVVFDGSSHNASLNADKLYVPGADAGMFIGCGTSSLIGRSGATSLFFYNDQFYFMLSYLELGIERKSNAPELKIDGNRAKPLRLAVSKYQQLIAEAVQEFHNQQESKKRSNEGSDS